MMAKLIVYLLPTVILATSALAEAQQTKNVPQIGVLSPFPAQTGSLVSFEAFRQALRDLGYIEGQTIVIEYRYADGKTDRLPTLAPELVRLKVDLIFTTWGTAAAIAAKKTTTAIPIVMGAVGDPVSAGLVASLAHPGGNITGLSSVALDLEGKRIEMLKEVVPKIASVAVPWDPANPYSALAFKEEQAAAQALGVRLQPILVRDASDLESALSTMTRERPDGLSLHGYTVVVVHRARIVDFAAKSRLPAVYPMAEYVDDGGLMSYGTSFRDLYRCAATYVDKILKGAKPADLPVEQPTKFELVINLKTAKQIGVTIPQTVLYRADKVIK